MSSEISRKQLEEKAFKSTTNDGLWDIFVGSITLEFAVGPFLSSSLGDFYSALIFLPFWLIILLSIIYVRKNVVRARIGYVEFSLNRKRKLTLVGVILLLINTVALILGSIYALQNNAAPGFLTVVSFAAIILLYLSIAAYFLGQSKLFFYGLMIFLSLFIGEWLFQEYHFIHHGYPLTFGITTIIILAKGLYDFVTLLRKNPLPEQEKGKVE